MNDAPFVLETLDDGVLTLTLNRPAQFNALSRAMLEALLAALERAKTDEAVRAVVLAGAGKAFCAGHDLKEMRANCTLEFQRDLFALCTKVMRTIMTLPVPVIARVHGIATAAGCQLVATCDLAVAADVARFAVSGITVGLFCSTPAVALSRNIGRKPAMEMLLTGEFISAERAQTLGLVNRVVAVDALDDEINKLTDSIKAKPRASIAMGKSLFYRQLEMGIDAAYQLASEVMACNMMHPDAQEGIDAFIEKRTPRYQHTPAPENVV
ncbi:enoyl-CoA hydratase [Hydrogenophilus thermoluteolus]|uniref:Enoyl-CoA hydratase domain-containing protein 3, mitochondrial n=1 Tax=Hydrogenophilus thermoluteolus TaxID=297 RepID=A0A2Z6DY23_HYDTE|nr:enoyl-CoA hydratase [Hydrogenophilus thermoluteolus]HCO77373.1 enoyl-CoA hydratase [Rhodocyclaceae bacterium]MBW7655701.1 enoyl-CoA hydratase [Hydrogenophilus thermoluteolus]BBD77363.1 enoyl-CoA hydratase [Hydrogenophilus thermoluteolus]GLW61176.1 enoyl-CoA hydratase [Hydrogenophilus thermoluteolus]HNQ48838.1 enoyl-CoA hydratase [Hydrogenophilus thermoluteolus]